MRVITPSLAVLEKAQRPTRLRDVGSLLLFPLHPSFVLGRDLTQHGRSQVGPCRPLHRGGTICQRRTAPDCGPRSAGPSCEPLSTVRKGRFVVRGCQSRVQRQPTREIDGDSMSGLAARQPSENAE